MPDIYLIAGEASGDVLGGRLMEAIKNKEPAATFYGVGGDMMQAQGLNSLFPMQDLSVMGLAEILPRLPKITRRVYQTVRDIEAKQPDIVITIDAPDFCKPVVKRARKKCPNTQFIHYVAPTVWAWRPQRAKKMAQLFDGLICLLPFEPDYFKNEGLDARFCGHPILEAFSNKLSSGFTKESPEKHPNHILIFPGSRMGEVKRMAPIFRETFNQMKTMNPDLQAHIVAFDEFRNMLDEEFLGLNYIYIDPENRYGAMLNAPFALAKSGTVGLELAVANCPHVIAYKMNKVTWQILKRLVKTPYAHLANILAGKEIIPECIQDNCNAEYIMQRILHDLPEDMRFIREKLKGENPNLTPSEQAADYVLEMLK